MQLLVGEACVYHPVHLPQIIAALFRRVQSNVDRDNFEMLSFPSTNHFANGAFHLQNLFPSCAPDKLARFSSPEFAGCRIDSIHPPVLSEAFDSRPPAEVPRWFENAFLDQMRFDIVVHEQSLICRRRFQGKRGFRRRLKS